MYLVGLLLALQRAIAGFPEERLSGTIKGADFDYLFALYSMPCYDTAHAAQIVLLKKAPNDVR